MDYYSKKFYHGEKRVCSIPGCFTVHFGKGYCQKHWKRLVKNGDPEKYGKFERVSGNMTKRIMARVKVNEQTDCWEWQGYKCKKGYGRITISSGKYVLVHRYMYEHCVGKIPDGLFVCHSCDNPKCCNPEHLWVGTDSDNQQDSIEKGRKNAPCGEKHWKSKITNKERKLIVKEYTLGNVGTRALAKKLGISRGMVMTAIKLDKKGILK